MFITCNDTTEKNAFCLCMSNPHTTGPKQNTFQTGKPEPHLNSKIQPMERWPRWMLTDWLFGGRKNPHGTRQRGGFRPFWTRGTAVIDTFHFLFLSRASQRGLGQLSVIWGLGQSSLIKMCKKEFEHSRQKYSWTGMGFHNPARSNLLIIPAAPLSLCSDAGNVRIINLPVKSASIRFSSI